jgi:hypothetical protein
MSAAYEFLLANIPFRPERSSAAALLILLSVITPSYFIVSASLSGFGRKPRSGRKCKRRPQQCRPESNTRHQDGTASLIIVWNLKSIGEVKRDCRHHWPKQSACVSQDDQPFTALLDISASRRTIFPRTEKATSRLLHFMALAVCGAYQALWTRGAGHHFKEAEG